MMDKFDVDVELCSAASLLKLTDYTFEFEFFCFKNELTVTIFGSDIYCSLVEKYFFF